MNKVNTWSQASEEDGNSTPSYQREKCYERGQVTRSFKGVLGSAGMLAEKMTFKLVT